MKDYSKAETKVVASDANRVRTEDKGYTPARGKAYGASETGSSAKLGGRGSSGNKSRHHRYGGFKGTALVVLLTFSMVFASLLGAFADDLKNTVPVDENYTTNLTTYTKPSGDKAKQQTQNGTTVGTTTLAGDTYVKGKPAPSNIQQSRSPGSVTTFAAGLAKSGLIPVFAVYSSFLQRAFDQILHDVCIQNLHVIFAIDRAGLVGSDGETHQGIFDISYLSVIPNMTIMAPKNKWELSDMMKFAVAYDGPIALRYPRGEAYDGLKEIRQPIELAKSELIRKGSAVAIMALGSMVKTAVDVVKLLEAEGISATLINARFAMPFDKEVIKELPAEHSLLVTMEENVQSGGFGEHVTEYVKTNGIALEVLTVALPDCYVEHGNVEVLKKELHVDAESVAKRIIAAL